MLFVAFRQFMLQIYVIKHNFCVILPVFYPIFAIFRYTFPPPSKVAPRHPSDWSFHEAQQTLKIHHGPTIKKP